MSVSIMAQLFPVMELETLTRSGGLLITLAGFSYTTSRTVSVHNVEVITDWPGNAAGHREKVPSQIAYSNENTKLKKDAWGYEIPSGVKSHCWTKLLLDKDAGATDFDDPKLINLAQMDELALPSNKAPEEVVTDYLSFLYKHCMLYLEKKMTASVLRVTPIEFWFTMPAIWSDHAQSATKSAAENAGFGKSTGRENDSISMIREPEAAAIAALKISADKYDDLLKVSICRMVWLTIDEQTIGWDGYFDLRLRWRYSGEFCSG